MFFSIQDALCIACMDQRTDDDHDPPIKKNARAFRRLSSEKLLGVFKIKHFKFLLVQNNLQPRLFAA